MKKQAIMTVCLTIGFILGAATQHILVGLLMGIVLGIIWTKLLLRKK